MAKNVYSLQLLRNGTPFTSYTAAVDAITGGTEQDGVLKLARYTDSNNEDPKYRTATIKTIFGIRHSISGATGGTGWTVFDSYTEVIENLQQQIDAMGGDSGSIAEQIKSAIDALNYTGVTTGDGVVVTNVIQESGVVSANSAEVGGLKLTNYAKGSDSGAVVATDSINAAISKLENQVDAVKAEKDAAIEALDYIDTAVTGSYVSAVDEADGVISVTRVALPSAGPFAEAGKPIVAVEETLGEVSASAGTINAEFVNVADAGNLFSSTTVEATLAEIDAAYKAADAAIVGGASDSANTLSKLEGLINDATSDAKSYSIEAITGSELTNLDANAREAYKLVDEDGVQSGEIIKIYKDQTLKNAEYSGQSLVLTYILADGSESAVSIDMHDLIEQTEFASGVTWDATASKVRGVVDSTSETFLTVGADGFKLAGVQDAIDDAVEEAQGALDELSGKTEALSAKTVTEIASSDASIAVATAATTAADGTVKYDLTTNASKVKVSSTYAAQNADAIATGDTVDVALAKLEAQVAAAKDAATTKVVEGTDAGNNMEIVPTTSATDSSVTYTINLTDVASDSALTAEIAARKAVDGVNGDAYTADTTANYINGASSLYGADQALDAALKTVADSANSAQTEIDAIETAVGLNADGTYSPNTTNNYTSGATSVNDAIDALDDAVKANEDAIDALEQAYVSSVTVNGVEVAANNAAPIVLEYDNTAAESEEGMVIDTDSSTGAMTIQFGTLDAGTY